MALISLWSFTSCQNQTSTSTAKTNDMTMKNPYYSRTDTLPLKVSDDEWKKVLPDSVFQVGRKKATEMAFTGKYWNFSGVGTYYCAVCGNALFCLLYTSRCV